MRPEMTPPRLDLTETSVFLDFDGTISTRDIGLELLERHGRAGWRAIDAAFVRGEMGSRECVTAEWDLVEGTEAELLATAMEVTLDPGFPALVADLRSAGAEVAVLSDGFGFYVDAHCRAAGVTVAVYANRVDWDDRALRFPFGDPTCACRSCGVCKQAPIRAAAARGRATVMVGDGASDRKAAAVADVVFATAGLARWCEEAGVPFTPYATLRDVHAALLTP